MAGLLLLMAATLGLLDSDIKAGEGFSIELCVRVLSGFGRVTMLEVRDV